MFEDINLILKPEAPVRLYRIPIRFTVPAGCDKDELIKERNLCADLCIAQLEKQGFTYLRSKMQYPHTVGPFIHVQPQTLRVKPVDYKKLILMTRALQDPQLVSRYMQEEYDTSPLPKDPPPLYESILWDYEMVLSFYRQAIQAEVYLPTRDSEESMDYPSHVRSSYGN